MDRLAGDFADALANLDDIDLAARAVGRDYAWGLRQFKAICDRLGPQATRRDLGWRRP